MKLRHETRLIEADQVGALVREGFLPGPNPGGPLPHPTIVALLGAWLRTLRPEAARPEQATHVIGMVDDLEVVTDEIDDPPTRPQARRIAGRFGPRHHQARQLSALRRGQLGRSTGGRAGAQTGPAMTPMRPFPPADRAPIDTEAFGYDMNRYLTLQIKSRTQVNRIGRRAPKTVWY